MPTDRSSRTKTIRTTSDGYFVCDLRRLRVATPARLNLLDPHKVWTWDPAERRPFRRLSEEATTDVAPVSNRALPHYGQLSASGTSSQRVRIPVAFRLSAAQWQSKGDYQDEDRHDPQRRPSTRGSQAPEGRARTVRRARGEHSPHVAQCRRGETGDGSAASFNLQFEEEVEAYERLKRGDLGELDNLHGLGRTLVALRIALGSRSVSSPSDFSRERVPDLACERNEYQGVTVDRASRILDALG